MTSTTRSDFCRGNAIRGFGPLLIALLVAALAGAAPVAARDDAGDLVTDRPDQTESALVVPRGYVQIETGWLYTRDEERGFETETFEVPGTLVRIGLSERVELRLGWTGLVFAELAGPFVFVDEEGAGDAELGAKIHLATERDGRPEIALLVATSVPVGEAPFTSDEFDPSFRLSFAHTLSERLSLGYNVGAAWETFATAGGDDSLLSTYVYTLALGIGLSERWGAFVEVFGDVAGSAPGSDVHSLDGGFTYLIRDNMQFDVAAGVGLNDEAADWFVGAGFSARLPN